MKKLIYSLLITSNLALGWGEVGHHLIARSAVEILKSHPDLNKIEPIPAENLTSFLNVLKSKQYQQGHVANIPDTYWRNLEGELAEVGTLLGAPTHYLDSELLLGQTPSKDLLAAKIPLNYQDAKNSISKNPHFFKTVGTLPWRAQQLAQLYSHALNTQVSLVCKDTPVAEENTRVITAFAGLMAHFTGDVTMPYHSSIDHDARAIGQKGIHWYFENDLVTELELSRLFSKVVSRAESILKNKTQENGTPSIAILKDWVQTHYPQRTDSQQVTALMMATISDSYSQIEKLRQLDYTYAIASLQEALQMKHCQNLAVLKDLKAQYEKLETDEQKKTFGKVKVLSYPSDYDDKKVESACRRTPDTRVNQDGELSLDGKTVAQWHEDFIIERLALAASLTAEIWMVEWLKAKSPALCSTLLYAHKPSFVSPMDKNCKGYALTESPKEFILKNGKSALTQKLKTNHRHCVSF